MRLRIGQCGHRLYTKKTWSVKGRTDKLDLIKIKTSFSVKAQVRRIKRQARDWKKIYTHSIPNRELFSRIYKEIFKLNVKKKSN